MALVVELIDRFSGQWTLAWCKMDICDLGGIEWPVSHRGDLDAKNTITYNKCVAARTYTIFAKSLRDDYNIRSGHFCMDFLSSRQSIGCALYRISSLARLWSI